MRRPRKAVQLPRCKDCRARIQWLRWHGGPWQPFRPGTVDARTHTGAAAFPVENGRVWRLEDLVEDLMLRHGYTRTDALDEAQDMPWAVPHDCRTNPTTQEGAINR